MFMFYLFVYEDGHHIITGKRTGYKTYSEAEEEAEKRVDDALPRNTVWIMQLQGYAALDGAGETYIQYPTFS